MSSRVIANLWQAVVQHPQSARGWAEFAKAFATRFNWANARLALDKAMASPPRPSRFPQELFAALSTMAEQSALGDLAWEGWFSTLSPEIQATPEGAGLFGQRGPRGCAKACSENARKGRKEVDVNACFVASVSAYGEEDLQHAYQFLKRAFELDLPSALRHTVMRFSGQTAKILEETQSVDEMACW